MSTDNDLERCINLAFNRDIRNLSLENIYSILWESTWEILLRQTSGEEDIMRVPDELLQSVVFLGYNDHLGYRQAGTAFFVSKLVDIPNAYVGYVFTAKHVIVGIRENSIDGNVLLRINTRDHGVVVVTSKVDDWLFHPDDPFLDVAFISWTPQPQVFEFKMLSEETIVTDEVVGTYRIGVGDDLFLVGLFANHSGTNRNIPIVRAGSLAAMPTEPVQVRIFDTHTSIDAYLAEVRSIGGLSGSPVFVVTGGLRGGQFSSQQKIFLLGLVHGHWDVKFSKSDAALLDSNQSESINTGIAIVVPATKIVELLERPEHLDARTRVANERRKAMTNTQNDYSDEFS